MSILKDLNLVRGELDHSTIAPDIDGQAEAGMFFNRFRHYDSAAYVPRQITRHSKRGFSISWSGNGQGSAWGTNANVILQSSQSVDAA